jgi:uncharacterized membrane protein HdeD (DUF308 family)
MAINKEVNERTCFIMNLLKEERNERIADAVILIVIGVLTCCFSNLAADAFALVSGILCLIFASLYLFFYFASFIIHDPYLLLRGILLLFFGIWILSDPGAYLLLMVFFVSIYLMICGIEEIAYGADLARLSVKNWWADLLDGLICLALGISILVVEFGYANGVQMVTLLCGASLVYEGVMELVLVYALHRTYKRGFHKNVVSNQ